MTNPAFRGPALRTLLRDGLLDTASASRPPLGDPRAFTVIEWRTGEERERSDVLRRFDVSR